jgi:hypothetical protein
MPAQPPSPAARRPDSAAVTRRQLRGLRTGVSLTALLGGLALFVFLTTQLGLPGLLAGIFGFIFALLGRFAMVSLLRDWLLRVSRGRR